MRVIDSDVIGIVPGSVLRVNGKQKRTASFVLGPVSLGTLIGAFIAPTYWSIML